MSAAIATFRIPSSSDTSPGAINKAIGSAITLVLPSDQGFTSLLLECQDCGASFGSFHAYSTKYGTRSKLPVSVSLHNQMVSRKCQNHFQAHHDVVKKSRKRQARELSDDQSSIRSNDGRVMITSLESDSQTESQHSPKGPLSPLSARQLPLRSECESLSESNAESLVQQLDPVAKKQRCDSRSESDASAPSSAGTTQSQRPDQHSDMGVPSGASPSFDVNELSLPFKLTAFERDAIPALLQVTRQEISAACTESKREMLELDGTGTETLCSNILIAWVTTSPTFTSWCSQHNKLRTNKTADEFLKECRQKMMMRPNRMLRMIYENLRAYHRQTCRMSCWKCNLPTWAVADVFRW